MNRSIELLAILAAHPLEPMAVTEIADALGAARGSVVSVCTALEMGGLLERGADGYRLGRRLAELGGAYVNSFPEVQSFHEACARSSIAGRELVQLVMLDGPQVLVMARHEGRAPLMAAGRPGDRLPAVSTAAGRALLASLPAGDSRVSHRLQSELQQVRERGFALEFGEVHPAVTAIAAAVPSQTPSPAFAVGISLTGVRLTEEGANAYGRAARSIAAQTARRALRQRGTQLRAG
ncbi:IclR family transcriptional regulator [Sinomonas atrocyanea]|uniref:IclR family transcriptional regulator n=1 Tax=Sinomonas atrocyanea TaxID=37927 RepID=UPI00278A922C|nr:IclR family transcriptional regulator C-terminal domain-containing protein [Sinomonas atrocyanea]MDQ0259507.1 DNA-binding IclR family transcriptional regulator [Sinomonas atrocyanea]MDR6623351.1 DNA-binding IclR family transcriptional regulator [Sinomonas atrocyanea]